MTQQWYCKKNFFNYLYIPNSMRNHSNYFPRCQFSALFGINWHALGKTEIFTSYHKENVFKSTQKYLEDRCHQSFFFIFQNLGFSPNYCDICGKIIELKVSYHFICWDSDLSTLYKTRPWRLVISLWQLLCYWQVAILHSR